MLLTGLGQSVLGNCALCLEYGLRLAASGHTRDLGHSFSQNGPPGRWITYIYNCKFIAATFSSESEVNNNIIKIGTSRKHSKTILSSARLHQCIIILGFGAQHLQVCRMNCMLAFGVEGKPEPPAKSPQSMKNEYLMAVYLAFTSAFLSQSVRLLFSSNS